MEDMRRYRNVVKYAVHRERLRDPDWTWRVQSVTKAAAKIGWGYLDSLSGGKKTVVAPKAYAANGLVAGGEVITIDSSVVLIAQWKEKTVIKTEKDFDKEPSPGTGESSLPMAVAFNLAVISLLAIGAAIGRRKES